MRRPGVEMSEEEEEEEGRRRALRERARSPQGHPSSRATARCGRDDDDNETIWAEESWTIFYPPATRASNKEGEDGAEERALRGRGGRGRLAGIQSAASSADMQSTWLRRPEHREPQERAALGRHEQGA